MESIFSQKETLYCCCMCTKFLSFCKIIFIFSCIFSSLLRNNFFWMTLYHLGNTRCSKEARVLRIGCRARYRDHKSFTLFLAYFHTLNATDFACSALYCFLLYMNQTYGAPLKGSLNRIFRKMMKNS